MAKILLLFHQPIIDNDNPFAIMCFYESLIKELSKSNNNIMYINLALFKDYWCGTLNGVIKENIVNKVKIFNPDIIFAFNNQITDEIINNTNCPICLMDADSVEFFPNKDLIEKNKDRYYMFSFYKDWENEKLYLDIGVDKRNISFLYLATSIKKEKIQKTQNISFIGSKFPTISKMLQENSNIVNIYQDLLEYYNNQYENFDKTFNKCKKSLNVSNFDAYALFDARLYVLQSVFDLGLKIYGVNWDKLPLELINLRICYDKTPKYTLKHNSDIYNSSKINISISHPQCKGYAYPWRVLDIMASDGLLISSYSKLLEKQASSFVKIPMFQSPYEARDLCKYALQNPAYREDVILASNEFVEKNARWQSNFLIIQNITKVHILNDNNNLIGNVECVKTKIRKIKNEKRLKNIINGSALILMNIPIVERLFSNKLRKKVFLSLNKHIDCRK